MIVEVVPPNPEWKTIYQMESTRILSAVEHVPLTLHHIGSTSIPNIYAKPIIDMLGEVDEITTMDEITDMWECLGYEAMGEFGIPGRRYFRYTDERGIRKFHVHVFVSGSGASRRHLAFRDYLRTHPDVAYEYSQLKIRLANDHPESIDDYMDGKDEFIRITQDKAVRWQANA